jgi:hypothetical protein
MGTCPGISFARSVMASSAFALIVSHQRSTTLQARIRSLVVRMATDNPTWGYTRIQSALMNVDRHVGVSTIARILKAAGICSTPIGLMCVRRDTDIRVSCRRCTFGRAGRYFGRTAMRSISTKPPRMPAGRTTCTVVRAGLFG